MKAFIDEHRDAYGVEPICKVLPIAPSTYYLHAARRADPDRRSARAVRDERLERQIQRVWDENFQVYGVRKVWRQLMREGVVVARCTVERLMRRLGLQGVVRGTVRKTRISDKGTSWPPDRVNRQFRAERPNALMGFPGISSVGRCPVPPVPTSCWMRWSRPCRRADLLGLAV